MIINKSSENNDSKLSENDNDNNYNDCEDFISISLFTASNTILKIFEYENLQTLLSQREQPPLL